MNARTLLLTCACVLATGCSTMTATLPGTLRNTVSDLDIETVGTVQIERTQTYLLWGLVGAPPQDWIARELAQQLQSQHGEGMARIVFESQTGCLDLTITGLTLGCIAPRSYRLHGDVVRWRTGAHPASTAPVAPESPLPVTAPATPDAARF
jgi:hypothetical protein